MNDSRTIRYDNPVGLPNTAVQRARHEVAVNTCKVGLPADHDLTQCTRGIECTRGYTNRRLW